ncbi:MAG: RHS repeat-associated core domain-containing protein [Chthoniobacterales bacterium]
MTINPGYEPEASRATRDAEVCLGRSTSRYNIALGARISRDPIGEASPDGPNLYGYVRNNPTNLVDPIGEWGIAFGTMGGSSFNIGWGDPTFLFTPESGMDISMAAGATLDGIIPFWDPYADAGAYDPCDKGFAFSRAAGAYARDVYTQRLLLGGLARLGASRLPGTRWINSNRYLRLGESGQPPQLTLRVGQARPPTPWNHIPIK